MEELAQELDRINDTLSQLNKVQIQFGIFDEDGSQIEEISVYNLDGTVSKQQMQLSDIMYLTEKGTISIPSKPILYNIYRQISYAMPRVLDEITDGVFNKNWETLEIRNKLEEFNWRINNIFIPNAVNMVLSSDNVISGLLNEEEDTKYTYDLKKLKKFIKSKIFFTF